jgi:hypothetical protein
MPLEQPFAKEGIPGDEFFGAFGGLRVEGHQSAGSVCERAAAAVAKRELLRRPVGAPDERDRERRA